MKESTIQQNIIQTLSLYAGKYNFIYFAPMNEGVMMVLTMFNVPKLTRIKIVNWLKKMGFLPGVSDIIIGHNGKMFCMEVKTDKWELSDRQELFMGNVLKAGIDFAVVRSVGDCLECLKVWGIVK